MHASFRPCARSFSKAILGSLLMCAPLLLGQDTTVPVESNKDLPDAPMPVTTGSPTPSNPSFTRRTLPPSFDTSRTQTESWMGMSRASERPVFNTNALTLKENRPDGKDMKVAGRSLANRFTFDPVGGHAKRPATQGGNQWYTSHIPWAGSIVRRGLKISNAHPRLTTVIKTLKPRL
jgi:hypothetical protein